jgi:hypothetical protein
VPAIVRGDTVVYEGGGVREVVAVLVAAGWCVGGCRVRWRFALQGTARRAPTFHYVVAFYDMVASCCGCVFRIAGFKTKKAGGFRPPVPTMLLGRAVLERGHLARIECGRDARAPCETARTTRRAVPVLGAIPFGVRNSRADGESADFLSSP